VTRGIATSGAADARARVQQQGENRNGVGDLCTGAGEEKNPEVAKGRGGSGPKQQGDVWKGRATRERNPGGGARNTEARKTGRRYYRVRDRCGSARLAGAAGGGESPSGNGDGKTAQVGGLKGGRKSEEAYKLGCAAVKEDESGLQTRTPSRR